MTQPRIIIPVDLEKMIHALDKKMPRKVIAVEQKPYLELWNVSIGYYMAPIHASANHARKMKLAWLASGNTGLLEYIEPYFKNKRKFQTIRKLILAIK
jgi:hypothetical protein